MLLQEITTLVKKPLPLEEALVNSTWSLHKNTIYLYVMTFNSDGTIGSGSSANEKYWKWNSGSGYVEFIKSDKTTVSSKFFIQSINNNGKLMLAGP